MSWLLRMLAVAVKELKQLSRDRITFGMIVGIPTMQILLFGYAINFDVREVDAIVLDAARSSASRQLVAELQATQVLRVRRQVDSEAALRLALARGEGNVALVIPADLERRLFERDRPVAQLLIDGSQPTLENIAGGLAALPLLARHGSAVRGTPRLELRTEYNPEKRTAVQIVPALIGTILNMTMVVFTAGAIVRERERGNLELLITTPITSGQLMAGKLAPYVLIGLLQVSLILVIGHNLFDVPIRGSLFDLYLGAALFIAATLSLGLFISTLAQTQMQAFQMAFFTMLPSILMSGFMFPFDGMPTLAQYIAQLLPLTHFNEIVRGVVLRGAPLTSMVEQLAKLGVFTAVMMAAAMLRFHKRLD